jgi:hypothetical protein
MRKYKQFKFLSLVVIMVSFSFLLNGCDWVFSQNGQVYEWRDAPPKTTGEVYVNMEIPTGRLLEPVSNVTVSFGNDISGKTDDTGAFSARGITGGPPSMVDFTVSKPGYQTLNGEYQWNDASARMIILIVRDTY